MSARRASRMGIVLALVSSLVFGVAGCGRSTQDKIVGTWVTGHGQTAGYMEFTEGGMAKLNMLPSVKYKIVGDDVYTIEDGESVIAGHIVWVADDKFEYTVLSQGCQGLVVTYERVK